MATFGQLLEIVANVTGVAAEGKTALAGRLRHLNTLSFPPMPSTGGRFDYGASEILATCLVFELGTVFVPPALAARLVLSSWPEIAAAFRSSAASGAAADAGPWFAIASAGLSSVGSGVAPAASELKVIGQDARAGHEPSGARTELRVDAGLLYRDVVDAAALVARDTAASPFSPAAPAPARARGDLVSLDVRDYYWDRAVRLLSTSRMEEACASGRGGLDATEDRLAAYLLDPMSREQVWTYASVAIGKGAMTFAAGLAALLDEVFGRKAARNEVNPVHLLAAFAHVQPPGRLREALLRTALVQVVALAPPAPRPDRVQRRRLRRESAIASGS